MTSQLTFHFAVDALEPHGTLAPVEALLGLGATAFVQTGVGRAHVHLLGGKIRTLFVFLILLLQRLALLDPDPPEPERLGGRLDLDDPEAELELPDAPGEGDVVGVQPHAGHEAVVRLEVGGQPAHVGRALDVQGAEGAVGGA